MPLKKWEPFNDAYKFWKDFRFPSLDSSEVGDGLAVDIYEKDRNIIVEAGIPGIESTDVNIEVENSYLRIFGSKEEEKETKKNHYYSKEIKQGSFERIVHLPCPVQENKIKAEYEKGVLKIFLPKATRTRTKKIKIQIKDKKNKK